MIIESTEIHIWELDPIAASSMRINFLHSTNYQPRKLLADSSFTEYCFMDSNIVYKMLKKKAPLSVLKLSPVTVSSMMNVFSITFLNDAYFQRKPSGKILYLVAIHENDIVQIFKHDRGNWWDSVPREDVYDFTLSYEKANFVNDLPNKDKISQLVLMIRPENVRQLKDNALEYDLNDMIICTTGHKYGYYASIRNIRTWRYNAYLTDDHFDLRIVFDSDADEKLTSLIQDGLDHYTYLYCCFDIDDMFLKVNYISSIYVMIIQLFMNFGMDYRWYYFNEFYPKHYSPSTIREILSGVTKLRNRYICKEQEHFRDMHGEVLDRIFHDIYFYDSTFVVKDAFNEFISHVIDVAFYFKNYRMLLSAVNVFHLHNVIQFSTSVVTVKDVDSLRITDLTYPYKRRFKTELRDARETGRYQKQLQTMAFDFQQNWNDLMFEIESFDVGTEDIDSKPDKKFRLSDRIILSDAKRKIVERLYDEDE